jgi:hypothetical protein
VRPSRAALVTVALATAGCGLLQDFGPPRERAQDASIDAPGLDAPGLDAPNPCAGRPDGATCDGTSEDPRRHLCLAGDCVPSLCGDGFLDEGFEECEPSISPACDPATCSFECTTPSDCPSRPPCELATCIEHRCGTVTPSEPTDLCTIEPAGAGHCVGGLCVPTSCGDGDVTGSEECDDPDPTLCVGCRFACHEDGDCSDGDACNGFERCMEVVDGSGGLVGKRCEGPWEFPACIRPDACHTVACVSTGSDTWACDEALIDLDGDGVAAGVDCMPGSDCDDRDPGRYPGALEICNGIDDDCDGARDEETVAVDWCLDLDGDGYGDPATRTSDCMRPSDAHVRDCSDCFDDPTDRLAARVHPGQTEFFTEPYLPRLATASFDYDCDGVATQRHTAIANCGVFAPVLCRASTGWTRTVPPCGTASYFADCEWELFCRRSTSLQTQACR